MAIGRNPNVINPAEATHHHQIPIKGNTRLILYLEDTISLTH